MHFIIILFVATYLLIFKLSLQISPVEKNENQTQLTVLK